MTDPLEIYQRLQAVFVRDVKSRDNQARIGDRCRASWTFLKRTEPKTLKSLVPGKQCFAFQHSKKLSRAVNKQQRLELAKSLWFVPRVCISP